MSMVMLKKSVIGSHFRPDESSSQFNVTSVISIFIFYAYSLQLIKLSLIDATCMMKRAEDENIMG
jgi:hypothetical protein